MSTLLHTLRRVRVIHLSEFETERLLARRAGMRLVACAHTHARTHARAYVYYVYARKMCTQEKCVYVCARKENMRWLAWRAGYGSGFRVYTAGRVWFRVLDTLQRFRVWVLA